MSTAAIWEAWIEAHHEVGCAERSKDVRDCRYRAAHIRTSKVFAEILLAKGYRLVAVDREPVTVAIWGDDGP